MANFTKCSMHLYDYRYEVVVCVDVINLYNPLVIFPKLDWLQLFHLVILLLNVFFTSSQLALFAYIYELTCDISFMLIKYAVSTIKYHLVSQSFKFVAIICHRRHDDIEFW